VSGGNGTRQGEKDKNGSKERSGQAGAQQQHCCAYKSKKDGNCAGYEDGGALRVAVLEYVL